MPSRRAASAASAASPSTGAPRVVPTGPRSARLLSEWWGSPDRISALWRSSLRFRTVAVTLALTAATITVACVWMALAIQNDLFESRKTQVLTVAQNATAAAQAVLDSSEVEGDRAAAQNLMNSVRITLSDQSSSDLIAVFRIDSDPSQLAPLGFVSVGLPEDVITPGLRQAVQAGPDKQWWQSVALPATGGGTMPGIVVGQQLIVPGVGEYELYLAYDLAAAQQTLVFIQGTLWVVGIGLVLLIGAISWFVLRSVTAPIGEAAETSAKLAAGELGVRLPVRGEDEMATLGRSFNAMADSIETQIKELADLSLVQQRFVSDVSHELRTPLTTIRLASDMLNDRRDDFDPATARTAELLHAQVQRFEVLLTDLLEISRYDAGSVQLELEPTSLATLAEDVVGSMQQLAEQHGSDVRLVAPGGYSPVDMDPRRIRRIARNLLGNAIEHGEGKPIVVTVDSDRQAVALGIRDFGIGMTAAETERIFDRFWRADPARVRTIGGTGLGMAIALGDATLHHGTLSVWSERGRGTNVVLTLPRDGAVSPTPPIPVDPGEDSLVPFDRLALTEPIDVPADLPIDLRVGGPGEQT